MIVRLLRMAHSPKLSYSWMQFDTVCKDLGLLCRWRLNCFLVYYSVMILEYLFGYLFLFFSFFDSVELCETSSPSAVIACVTIHSFDKSTSMALQPPGDTAFFVILLPLYIARLPPRRFSRRCSLSQLT